MSSTSIIYNQAQDDMEPLLLYPFWFPFNHLVLSVFFAAIYSASKQISRFCKQQQPCSPISLYGQLHTVNCCDLRPLQNAPFRPILASGSNFNPQNTECIPAVKIFAFLELKRNWAFCKGLGFFCWPWQLFFLILKFTKKTEQAIWTLSL